MKALTSTLVLLFTFGVHAQSKFEQTVSNELEDLLTDLENSTQVILGRAGTIDNSDALAAMKEFKDHVTINTKCFKKTVKSMAGTVVSRLKPYYNQKETLKETNNTHTQAYKNLLVDIKNEKEKLETELSKTYRTAYAKLLNLGIETGRYSSCYDQYSAGGISYVTLDTYKVYKYRRNHKYYRARFSYQSDWRENIWAKHSDNAKKSKLLASYKQKAGKRLIGVRKCRSDLCAIDLMAGVLDNYLVEIEKSVKRSLKFEAVKVSSPETSVSASEHGRKLGELIDIYSESLSSVVIR